MLVSGKNKNPACAGFGYRLRGTDRKALSKVVTVMTGAGTAGRPVDGIVQHLTKANDQTSAKRERVDGLIGVYAASIVVVIVSVSCRVDRGEELGLQLNTYAGRDIDICPYL